MEKKEVNTNEMINNNIEFEKDKKINDINKTETTLDNESSNQTSNIQNNNTLEEIIQDEENKNEQKKNDNESKENKDILNNINN